MTKRKRSGYWKTYERSQINNPHMVFDFCHQITESLGDPWEKPKRGRPYKTQPREYAASIIFMVYRNYSFRSAGGFAGIPKSDVHWAMKKIPLNYLRKALRCLHNWINNLLGKGCYMADSTGISTDKKEKAEHVLGFQIKKEHLKMHCITHYFPEQGLIAVADAVPTLGKRHDSPLLREMLPSVEGSGEQFFADRAYDAEANYEMLFKQGFIPQIKKRKNSYKGFYRKKAQKRFDPEAYKRLRCVVEGIFGGTETRYGNFVRHRLPHNRDVFIVCMPICHGIKTYLRAREIHKISVLLVIYWTTPVPPKAL